MRFTPRGIGNGIAWAGICVLIAVAVCTVWMLGFPGVLILGLLTTLVCVRAELSDAVPSWGRAVFEASASRHEPAERRAAARANLARGLSSLRYFRRCGLLLVAAGLLGTIWQLQGW